MPPCLREMSDNPHDQDTWHFDADPRTVMLDRRGKAAVVARIVSLMSYWGITLDDLAGDTPAASPSAPATPLPVKYRHPVSGETWDGQGAHPDWLRNALLKEGLRVDELKPEFQAAAQQPPEPDR